MPKTGIRIDHNFSSDREARRRKNHWYIEILKEEIAADPSDDSRLDFLAAEYHQLEMFDEATEIAERIAQRAAAGPAGSFVRGRLSFAVQARSGARASRFQSGAEAPPGLRRSRTLSFNSLTSGNALSRRRRSFHRTGWRFSKSEPVIQVYQCVQRLNGEEAAGGDE